MAKVIGGLVRFVFLTALTAALGYNYWQVQVLRGEVESLKAGSTAARAPMPQRPSPETPTGALELLSRSKAHADQAQKLLAAGRLDLARKELGHAGDALRRASTGIAPDTGVLLGLQQRLKDLSRQAQNLIEASGDDRSQKAQR